MKQIRIFFLMALGIAAFACTDPGLQTELDGSDHYRNVADARSAVLGLYGQFMELADRVVVLNELRADLMDVTPNADEELQAISYLTSDASNSWADPSPFYEVIQNCNDVLAGLDDMLANARLSQDEYDEIYSDITTMRCWIYLRIGAIYGKVPYITDVLNSVDEVKALDASTYMDLDQLIPTLIGCMEALPTWEQYSAGNELNTVQDGYSLSYYSLNKRCLMMELYLWNDEYEKAAQMFRDFERPYESVGGDGRYKNFTYVYQGSFNGAFMVTYTRNMYSDYNSLQQLWAKMFSLGIGEKYANWEHITCLTYDKNFEPTYPFIRLFGTEGLGEYLLMPSANAVDNYWGAQVQTNGFEFDGRGITGSYIQDEEGRNVIQKYLSDYDAAKPYEQSGRWFVYRAGWMVLLYAEACNRVAESGLCYQNDTLRPYSAYRKLAYGMLNNGINVQFNFTREDGTAYPGDSIYVSGWWAGASGNFPDPYDFDCRYNTTPYCRGPWRDAGGIRGRASLVAKTYDEAAQEEYDTEVEFLENTLLEEMALETAFEGHRWNDLVRIARRQNRLNPGQGTALLNRLMQQKFDKNGQAFTPFAADESNWYLPVKFE